MPRLKNRVPRVCRHHKGQAFVKIDGRTVWLGPYGADEARERYDRLIAEWLSNGRRVPDYAEPEPERASVAEVVLEFWRRAVKGRCNPEGEYAYQSALRVVRTLYGATPADRFGPRKLQVVRDEMIRKGWVRGSINRQVGRVRRMFRWAVSQELVEHDAYERLRTLEGLRKGEAPDNPPVRPVPRYLVRRLRPHLSRPVRALINLQLLTGTRAGELVGLRAADLDMSGDVWTYTPERHKTAHRGKERAIYFGPRARRILGLFLIERPVDRPLFSPRAAAAERKACGAARGRRASQRPNPRRSARRVNERYTVATYRRAIHRAADRAFPPPPELARVRVETREGRERWETHPEWKRRLGAARWARLKQWEKDHHWGTHRLRHAAATALNREFGIEAAKLILGHSSLSMTQLYAEPNRRKAMEAMERVG